MPRKVKKVFNISKIYQTYLLIVKLKTFFLDLLWATNFYGPLRNTALRARHFNPLYEYIQFDIIILCYIINSTPPSDKQWI